MMRTAQSALQGYVNEIKLLSHLTKKKRVEIVKLHAHDLDMDNCVIYLVLDYGDTDFQQLLTRLQRSVENRASFIRLYWQQMLLAVQVIHEERIVHGGGYPLFRLPLPCSISDKHASFSPVVLSFTSQI